MKTYITNKNTKKSLRKLRNVYWILSVTKICQLCLEGEMPFCKNTFKRKGKKFILLKIWIPLRKYEMLTNNPYFEHTYLKKQTYLIKAANVDTHVLILKRNFCSKPFQTKKISKRKSLRFFIVLKQFCLRLMNAFCNR